MNIRLKTVDETHRAQAYASDVERALSDSEDLALVPGEAPDPRELLERVLGAPESVFVVAESMEPSEDGATVGLCLTGPLADPVSGACIPLVLVLWVATPYRHRGLARHLLEDVARQLSERGRSALALRTDHNDDALISMGERWGFTRRWEILLRD